MALNCCCDTTCTWKGVTAQANCRVFWLGSNCNFYRTARVQYRAQPVTSPPSPPYTLLLDFTDTYDVPSDIRRRTIHHMVSRGGVTITSQNSWTWLLLNLPYTGSGHWDDGVRTSIDVTLSNPITIGEMDAYAQAMLASVDWESPAFASVCELSMWIHESGMIMGPSAAIDRAFNGSPRLNWQGPISNPVLAVTPVRGPSSFVYTTDLACGTSADKQPHLVNQSAVMEHSITYGAGGSLPDLHVGHLIAVRKGGILTSGGTQRLKVNHILNPPPSGCNIARLIDRSAVVSTSSLLPTITEPAGRRIILPVDLTDGQAATFACP